MGRALAVSGRPAPIRPDAEDNARVRAFCALFEAEFGVIRATTALRRAHEFVPMSEDRAERAARLVAGVIERREDLDQLIEETADRLPLDEMALVDLTVLRIALYEMLFDNDAVRPNTAVRQAVSLAKRFGDDGSRRFVSGVLGAITRNRLQAGTAE
ncbi:MAG: transcription antitermination factor NusB [Chloroflexi bacterium]|nr:transcription antitermination factor NusB [Chloroflexota bacterium]MYF81384.1 transcription antitermination factor NusB [Chloroflexota bacterium]MYI04095.1 transcription antitermination factor NusB [Chloroflexota bacterium]